jgi:predicted porin
MLVGRDVLAQEAGQVGLNMAAATTFSGGQRAIGATFHVTSGLALRPSASFASSRYDQVDTVVRMGRFVEQRFSDSEQSWALGLAVSYFVSRKDDLSLYVSGGYSRVRSTIDREQAEDRLSSSILDAPVRLNRWSAQFGMQYQLKPRLGLYGEVGVWHDRGDTQLQRDLRSTSSFNSGVGLVFYFNEGRSSS